MKSLIIPALTIVLLLALPGCDGENESNTPVVTGDPSGELTSATDCKSFMKSTLTGPGSSGESAVLYVYDADTRVLTLTHVNAGFNCCPGELSVAVTVSEGNITVVESEREAGCHCNCLFDLGIRVRDLPPGSWSIAFVEPYRHPDDAAISFTADLRTDPTGEHRVPRRHYPWGF
ncbi:MAG: hypothetical protein RRA94_05700 [Bacteroidota bacterium]|nr:hypothetical protein [Bacteroidota bacterium]